MKKIFIRLSVLIFIGCTFISKPSFANLTVLPGQVYDNLASSTLVYEGGTSLIKGTLNNIGSIIGNGKMYVQKPGILNNSGYLYASELITSGGGTDAKITNLASGTIDIFGWIHLYAGGLENWGIVNMIGDYTLGSALNDVSLMINRDIFNYGIFRIDLDASCNQQPHMIAKIKNWHKFEVTGRGKLLPWDSAECPAYEQYSGQLIVNGNFNPVSSNISGGGIIGSGKIIGPLTVTSSVTISPGDNLGMMTIDSDLNFSGASLVAEIGGRANDQSDQLRINGTVDLSGTLNVVLTNGFNPQLGDSFDILTANTVAGEFETVNLPILSNGLNWNLQYLADRVRLSII